MKNARAFVLRHSQAFIIGLAILVVYLYLTRSTKTTKVVGVVSEGEGLEVQGTFGPEAYDVNNLGSFSWQANPSRPGRTTFGSFS